MKKSWKALSLALSLILILSLAACAAGGGKSNDVLTEQYEPSVEGGGQYEDSNFPASDTDTGYEPGLADAEGYEAGNSSVAPEKVIYSGEANIETLEFDETIKMLDEMVSGVDGYIQSSKVTGNDYYGSSYGESWRTAYYQLRIPSDRFSEFMGKLDTLGNVPYSYTDTENVSARYQDTEARLVALRAQEARYLELLNMANTIQEVLNIEQHLTDVRYEIERLESRIRSWDSQVDYSTLALNISEVIDYTQEPEDVSGKPTYGQQLSGAFNGTLKALGSFFKGLFKFLVGASPVLVLLAVIAVPVIIIFRARSGKKRKGGRREDGQ